MMQQQLPVYLVTGHFVTSRLSSRNVEYNDSKLKMAAEKQHTVRRHACIARV